MNTLLTAGLTLKEALDYYENGKHRRYTLLFAVNGGAFAIAKLLVGEPDKPGAILGGLTLQELAIGMALFTAVMVVDIFVFGNSVREKYLPGAFGNTGKTVLILLGLLQCTAWLLAGMP